MHTILRLNLLIVSLFMIADQPVQADQRSNVILDVWAQDALRARLLAVDQYMNVKEDLNVGGDTVVNGNVLVNENVDIGGSLVVDGPANFTNVFVGGPTGCSDGLLVLCGTLLINGTSVTGPTHLTGLTGNQGATGVLGPIGPTGPIGPISATGGSFTLLGTGPSTSCTTGTLVVNGGMGVGGNLNVCGYINGFTDYRKSGTTILNATGSNLSLGTNAGIATGGSDNVFVGNHAAQSNVSASANTIIGFSAAQSLTSGVNNTVIGETAGQALSSGSDNTLLGFEAGMSMGSSDVRNTYVGAFAGLNNAGGTDNVIIGASAANTVTSPITQCVVIGSAAGELANGSSNVFLGYLSGQAAGPDQDVLIGYLTHDAGSGISSNTVIGADAFINIPAGSDHNTVIGAGASITSGADQIQLGAVNTKVYVSTTTGFTGGVLLPTSAAGAIPNSLNYYEEVTMPNFSVLYDNSAGTVPTTLYITRIGNRVTLTLDPIPPVGMPGGGNGVFVLESLPTRFCPPVAAGEFISKFVGPVTEVFNDPGNRFIGEWVVFGNGVMLIQTIYQGASQITFNGDEYQTLGQLSITYSLNP